MFIEQLQYTLLVLKYGYFTILVITLSVLIATSLKRYNLFLTLTFPFPLALSLFFRSEKVFIISQRDCRPPSPAVPLHPALTVPPLGTHFRQQRKHELWQWQWQRLPMRSSFYGLQATWRFHGAKTVVFQPYEPSPSMGVSDHHAHAYSYWIRLLPNHLPRQAGGRATILSYGHHRHKHCLIHSPFMKLTLRSWSNSPISFNVPSPVSRKAGGVLYQQRSPNTSACRCLAVRTLAKGLWRPLC